MTFFTSVLDFYDCLIITDSQHLPRNTILTAQQFSWNSVGPFPNKPPFIQRKNWQPLQNHTFPQCYLFLCRSDFERALFHKNQLLRRINYIRHTTSVLRSSHRWQQSLNIGGSFQILLNFFNRNISHVVPPLPCPKHRNKH